MARRLVRELNVDLCRRLGFEPDSVTRIEVEPDVIYVHELVEPDIGMYIRGGPRTKIHSVYFYEDGEM